MIMAGMSEMKPAEVFGVGLAWSWFGQRKEPDGVGVSRNFAEGAWHKGPC